METTAEFTAENQMLFFYLCSTTFQWFSFHSWIDSLLYVLLIHSKTLILMNIVLLVLLPPQDHANALLDSYLTS